MVKIKGSLLLKKQLSDIIAIITLEFKEEFKNLDLQNVIEDSLSVQYLMRSIEKKLHDKTLLKQSFLKDIDKTDILMQIIISLFPAITDSEIKTINKIVNIIINNDLVKYNIVYESAKKKFAVGCKRSYRLIKYFTYNFFTNNISNKMPIVNKYSNTAEQIIVYKVLVSCGIKLKIAVLICMFL